MTTDRELMQQALDLLDDINQCSLPPTGIPLPAEIDHVMEALRARLAQPEQEPVATLFGSLPVYDVPQAEPVAWRTFDGEGGYEYRSYEMNENYAEEWNKRNPNHKGWVEPLYADPTPCQTCEALARTVMMDQTSHDTPPQREWQSLTDEEIAWLYRLAVEATLENMPRHFARMVEEKLKEKNNG